MRWVEKLLGAGLFIMCSLWFYFPGEYAMIANRDTALFMTTPEYFFSSLKYPGGFIEYLGNLLNQFLRFRLTGAIMLSGVVTSAYFATLLLIRKVSRRKEFLAAGLLTPLILVGMHNHYPHQVHHSLGFIFAMILAACLPGKRSARNIYLALAVPLFYQVAGGYIWIFGLTLAAKEMVHQRKFQPWLLFSAFLYPAVIIFAGSWLLYLRTLEELLIQPLPSDMQYGAGPLQYLLILWILLQVVIAGTASSWNPAWRKWRLAALSILGLTASILVLHFSYQRKHAELFRIEKLAIKEDWEGLLHFASMHPSMNLFGSYYTNLALVNTGRLCSDLFGYPQPFGRRGLCLEWEAKEEILRRGSDFFWTANLVNEAHHWAYEAYVIEGFTFRNLKMLIQTELVRGNDRVAEKYIRVLDHALFGKKLAAQFTPFPGNRDAIRKDPVLGPRAGAHFRQDFFSDGKDMERNLVSLVANDASNRYSVDYLMALFLLEKRVDKIAAYLPEYLEHSRGVLPPLLEEGLLVFQVAHREENLPGPRVSPNTLSRFQDYTAALRNYRNQYEAAQSLYPSYGNSFWFYLNFSELPK